MKKYLLLILLVIFFCASFLIKQDLLMNGSTMSENERATNYCMQMATGLPIGLGVGIIWFLMPRRFFYWFSLIFGTVQSSSPALISVLMLQILGIITIVASVYSLVNECRFLL